MVSLFSFRLPPGFFSIISPPCCFDPVSNRSGLDNFTSAAVSEKLNRPRWYDSKTLGKWEEFNYHPYQYDKDIAKFFGMGNVDDGDNPQLNKEKLENDKEFRFKNKSLSKPDDDDKYNTFLDIESVSSNDINWNQKKIIAQPLGGGLPPGVSAPEGNLNSILFNDFIQAKYLDEPADDENNVFLLRKATKKLKKKITETLEINTVYQHLTVRIRITEYEIDKLPVKYFYILGEQLGLI